MDKEARDKQSRTVWVRVGAVCLILLLLGWLASVLLIWASLTRPRPLPPVTAAPSGPPEQLAPPDPIEPPLTADQGEFVTRAMRFWLSGPYWAKYVENVPTACGNTVYVRDHSRVRDYLPVLPNVQFATEPDWHYASALPAAAWGRPIMKVEKIERDGNRVSVVCSQARSVDYSKVRQPFQPSFQDFQVVFQQENGEWKIVLWSLSDWGRSGHALNWQPATGEVEDPPSPHFLLIDDVHFDGTTWVRSSATQPGATPSSSTRPAETTTAP